MLEIEDEMTDGFKLDKSSIKAVSDKGTLSYTMSNDTDITFDLSFTDVYSLVVNDGATKITVTYSATLTEDATVYTSSTTYDKNEVTLTYSNDPHDSSSEGTATDTVANYTYQVEFKKVANSASGPALEDAEFELYESNGTTEIKLAYDGSADIYYPSSTGSDTIVTQADGVFYIVGLDAGTYIIKETQAPTGYKNVGDTVIIITNGGYSGDTISGVNLQVDSDTAADITSRTVAIVNVRESALPETGGIGTLIFYVLGASLISFGSFIIYKRRT